MWHPPWDQGLHVFFRWNNWWVKITWKIAMLSIVSRWYPIRLSIISCYLSCWLHNIQKIMIFRIGDTTGYPISKNRTGYWSLITWYLIVVFQPHKNNGIAGPLYKTVYKPIIGIGLRMLPGNQKTTLSSGATHLWYFGEGRIHIYFANSQIHRKGKSYQTSRRDICFQTNYSPNHCPNTEYPPKSWSIHIKSP